MQKTPTTSKARATLTTEPLAIPPRVITATLKPETIRLPKPKTLCPYTGLSRSAMNELVLPCAANAFKPPVRSTVLRKRGARTGIRLVYFDSLLEHLHANVDTFAEAAERRAA